MLIESKRIVMEDAADGDVDLIIDIESRPENRDFIWIGTREEHLAEIRDPNHMLLLMREKTGGDIIGYTLIRLDFKSNLFEIRRIVITRKGEGFGREAMQALIRYAFEETETNRLWLDVYPDNEVGIRLYESLHMHRDGILRQNYKAERGYLDQIIYSILRSEYQSTVI